MKRNIWLIRHAQSEGNRDRRIQGHFDTPLTELGLEQAQITAKYFQERAEELNISAIFSSDLMRAKQTAEPIAQALKLTVETNPEWREAYFGRWEGICIDQIPEEERNVFERWQRDKLWRPDWCESFSECQARGLRSLTNTLTRSSGNLIILAHGGLIFSMLSTLITEEQSIPTIQNCGITHLEAEAGQISLVSMDLLAEGLVRLPNMMASYR